MIRLRDYRSATGKNAKANAVPPYPDTFRIDDHTLYADDPALKPSERDSLEAG